MRRPRPRLLLSALAVTALTPLTVPAGAAPPGAAPGAVPAGAAQAAAEPAARVTPEPQQQIARPDGFPVTPIVGLVRGKDSDADSERVVRAVLQRAGVRIVTATDGSDPRTPTTIWLGQGDAALAGLGVDDATGLAAEGYVLAVGRYGDRHHVVLDGADTDGTYYAAQSLGQLVQPHRGRFMLPGVEIRDSPTMRYRGSIEGFYGTPWSHADRLDHVGYLGEHKMNTYEYAPKDDPYHRERWRDPYPADKLAQLGELVTRSNQNKVDFTFALSPGLDICYTSETDFQALVAKFEALYGLGGRAFNVPLDDIDYSVWHCDADRAKYGTGGGAAGRAQSDLLNRVQREWVETKPDVAPLQMVPTEYYNVSETPYKKALRDLMDSDVVVHWTGIGVVPRAITAAQAAQAKAVFGHDILIWDNYPVNDYAGGRLLLADYSGREPGIAAHVAGVISNPMNQAAVSKVALYSFGELGWKPAAYDERQSWLDALAERAGGDAATIAALKVFADLNTYDGTLHPESAPELGAATEAFWETWRGGDRAAAVKVLRPRVNAVAAAPAAIRSGVVDPAFTAEAESWLKATELWGQAMQRSLDLLAALDAGDGATAWTARQQVTALVTQAKAIRDSRAPHSGTHPRIGERVVDELVAEAGRVHDRWLGVDPGRTATTTLGTYQDNVPARMVDGDLSTFFWSNGAPGPGAEVRVDLGDAYEIGDIAVLMGKAGSPDDFIHSGALEYSVDGTRWTELTRGTTAEVRATAPAGTTARYVRYRSLTSNDFWLVVREFSVEAVGATRTTLTVTGAPTPATGSSYGRAADGNVETAYVAAAAAATGDALTATLSAPRALAGVTVLQRDAGFGAAALEVRTGGTWRPVGPVSRAYADLDTGDVVAEAVRLVWAAGGTPQVAEIVPRWADQPPTELTLDPAAADAVAGTATTVRVDLASTRGEDVTGTLAVTAPPGWTVDPASSQVTVARGFTLSVPVSLTPPAGAPPGSVEIPVTFTTGGETVTATATVSVRPRTSATNAALRRPVTASGVEPGTTFTPELAVDGNATTRWSSDRADGAWLQVDLGTRTELGKVVLRWEAAYGTAYRIQVSDDGSTWTTAAEVTGGDGGTDTVWPAGTGRYLRMQGVDRATAYGYSLYELEVYPTVT